MHSKQPTNKNRYHFAELSIPVGSELVYTKNDSIKCTVYNSDNEVLYNEEFFTLSGLK